MHVLQLGDAFDKIAVSMSGRLIPGAIVIDVEDAQAYTWGELTEVFDMQSSTYLRDGWLERGAASGVFLLLRMNAHPIVVYVTPPPVSQENGHVSGDSHIMEEDGHSFDVLDMSWECVCGNTNDPDQGYCGECPRANPFLGVLL